MARPRSAPGPSPELLLRKKRAERDVKAARQRFERLSAEFEVARGATGLRINRAAPELLLGHRKRLEGAQADLRLAVEEVRKAEQDSQDYPVPSYLEAAHREGAFLIAVVGNTGVGKSSWVNAVRRLRTSDPGAAKTGEGEVTLKPERYDYPAPPEAGDAVVPVAIWDLPGVGTTGYPPDTYLRDLGIRYFDAAVLITDQRFSEAEMLLLDELRVWKVPFFLVRNKIDIDVDSEIVREEERHFDLNMDCDSAGLDAAVCRVIARDVVANVKRDLAALHGVGVVYCISAKKKCWSNYDFAQLEDDIAAAIRLQRTKMQDPAGRGFGFQGGRRDRRAIGGGR